MKLEDQVCSLDFAKRLKELGVKQESYFKWYLIKNESELMKFGDAIIALQNGKKIKLPDQNYYLSLIPKLYYDGNTDRPCEMLSVEDHILRNDWQIVE